MASSVLTSFCSISGSSKSLNFSCTSWRRTCWGYDVYFRTSMQVLRKSWRTLMSRAEFRTALTELANILSSASRKSEYAPRSGYEENVHAAVRTKVQLTPTPQRSPK
ncbi:hypothetical protein ABW19_dt0208770 [Dactylella cylindrospora]|nr:hypothetical protein ABW19_dt0208770 [Dactylella cylindrospora]